MGERKMTLSAHLAGEVGLRTAETPCWDLRHPVVARDVERTVKRS